MKFFRRRKGEKKEKKQPLLQSIIVKTEQLEDDQSSVGDTLLPEDQFFLEIPMKRRSYPEDDSTISSISWKGEMASKKRRNKKKHKKHLQEEDVATTSWCCAVSKYTVETEETNSIVTGSKNFPEPSSDPVSFMWNLCVAGSRDPDEPIESLVDSRRDIQGEVIPSVKRDTSLFDMAIEEEQKPAPLKQEYDDEESVMAVLEEHKSRMAKIRSVPKLQGFRKSMSRLRKSRLKRQQHHDSTQPSPVHVQ